jgi:hypothetical protein
MFGTATKVAAPNALKFKADTISGFIERLFEGNSPR